MAVDNSLCFITPLDEYIKVFEQVYPEKKITDKSYNVTLCRHIIFFFLYLENIKKSSGAKITYQMIANYFNCKRNTIWKGRKQIIYYRKHNKLLGKQKVLFFFFFNKCAKIYSRYK